MSLFQLESTGAGSLISWQPTYTTARRDEMREKLIMLTNVVRSLDPMVVGWEFEILRLR
jgi:hypothetical protein